MEILDARHTGSSSSPSRPPPFVMIIFSVLQIKIRIRLFKESKREGMFQRRDRGMIMCAKNRDFHLNRVLNIAGHESQRQKEPRDPLWQRFTLSEEGQ